MNRSAHAANRGVGQPKVLAGVFNPIAYDGRVQRECEALSEIVDVELICPHGPEVPGGLPFKVTTVRLPGGLTGPAGRHLKFASALIAKALRIRPTIIHAHDFFMAAPSALAAKISGARLIYDAHELIIPDLQQPQGRRTAYWYRTEAWAIKRAQLIIAANDERSDLMREHYRLRIPPLIVRNIPPFTKVRVDALCAAQGRGVEGEKVCVYQGDVNLKRGLGRIIEAVSFLPENVRLLIVGGGPDEESIRRQVQVRGLDNRVTLLGRVQRADLLSILSACHLGLITYPFEGLNNIYCAPNKVFEYAQAGLPIVATEQPPLARLLRSYDIGLTFDRFESPASIADKIAHVIGNRARYTRGLTRCVSENSWDAEADRLRKAVSDLL